MRIAIIGPQNTGKTTFLQDLLIAFPVYVTPRETYRDIVKQNNLTINQKTQEGSQRLIRDFLNDQIAGNKAPDIVFDRCVVDNYIYTKVAHEMGKISNEFLEETETIMYASLEFLDALFFIPTTVAVKLENDLFRDIDVSYIDRVNCLFIETLFDIVKKTKIPVCVVSGTREQRVAQARKFFAIDNSATKKI